MAHFLPWRPFFFFNTCQRTYNLFLLTFVLALRDSAPLAGLARAASLSSESLSESPGSLSSMTWLFFFKLIGFLDLEFVPVLFDRVTATPFTEVVRDFALAEVPVPETRDVGTVLAAVVVTTDSGRNLKELPVESPAELLLPGRAFLLLDWGSWDSDLVTFLHSAASSGYLRKYI